jgi:hypothetical protein
MPMDLSRTDSQRFKNCCRCDEIDEEEDENVGSEHENVSTDTENGNCEDNEAVTDNGNCEQSYC